MDEPASMTMGVGNPTVVISDTPPAFFALNGEAKERRFYVRNEVEMGAAVAVVNILRRGWAPIAFIYMKPSGEVGVHGSSQAFGSVDRANAIMEAAKAKLLSELFRMAAGKRTLLRRLQDARFGFITGFPKVK